MQEEIKKIVTEALEKQRKDFEALLEEKVAEQKRELELANEKITTLENVFKNMMDPRLTIWNDGKSSNGSATRTLVIRTLRQEYRDSHSFCFGCGTTSGISIAHIVPVNRDREPMFGTTGGYSNDISAECFEN